MAVGYKVVEGAIHALESWSIPSVQPYDEYLCYWSLADQVRLCISLVFLQYRYLGVQAIAVAERELLIFFARLELTDFSHDTIGGNEFGVRTVRYASGRPSKRLPSKDGRARERGGETQRQGTEPYASAERIQVPDRRLVASC